MKNAMLVKYQAKSYFMSFIKSKTKFKLYKTENRRKINKYIDKLGFENIPLGKWTTKVENYDVVIFFDTFFNNSAAKYVKEHSDAKVCLYFWNRIGENNKQLLENKYVDEIYTYNPFDAKEYNIKYNSTFYSKNVKLKKSKIKYDVCFLGRDKGRNDCIQNIKKEFDSKGLKSHINIVYREKDFISYKKYLKDVSKSKCILDVMPTEKEGLSLRVMESLFLNKKLITNNPTVKEYDFYNKNNIFIIGKDNYDNLEKFLNSPYVPVKQEIIDYYEYDNFLDRF